jgi:hypothetical protein
LSDLKRNNSTPVIHMILESKSEMCKWVYPKNCIRDSKCIRIACSTFIIHIIFQRSFNMWKKQKKPNIFRIVSVVRYSRHSVFVYL